MNELEQARKIASAVIAADEPDITKLARAHLVIDKRRKDYRDALYQCSIESGSDGVDDHGWRPEHAVTDVQELRAARDALRDALEAVTRERDQAQGEIDASVAARVPASPDEVGAENARLRRLLGEIRKVAAANSEWTDAAARHEVHDLAASSG